MKPPPLVNQRTPRDCAVCALSMVSGEPYAHVVSWFGIDFEKSGAHQPGVESFLFDHGFTILKKSKFRGIMGEGPRPDWPPQPFAEIHICLVEVFKGAPVNHYVVMMEDGTVLDPRGIADARLSADFYSDVLNVVGLYRVREHVAYCRYTELSIVTCDSDAPDAFKVYRD